MIDSVSESSAWSEIVQLSLGKIHPIKNWSAQFQKSNSRFLINFHFFFFLPCLKNSQHDRKSIPQAAGFPEFQHHFKDLIKVSHSNWHRAQRESANDGPTLRRAGRFARCCARPPADSWIIIFFSISGGPGSDQLFTFCQNRPGLP